MSQGPRPQSPPGWSRLAARPAGERAVLRRLAARTGAHLAAREADPLVVSDSRLRLWPALRGAYGRPTELAEAVAIDTSGPLEDAVDRARRACLLNADAVVADAGGEVDAGVLVIVGGAAAPVLPACATACDGVARLVQVGVAG